MFIREKLFLLLSSSLKGIIPNNYTAEHLDTKIDWASTLALCLCTCQFVCMNSSNETHGCSKNLLRPMFHDFGYTRKPWHIKSSLAFDSWFQPNNLSWGIREQYRGFVTPIHSEVSDVSSLARRTILCFLYCWRMSRMEQCSQLSSNRRQEYLHSSHAIIIWAQGCPHVGVHSLNWVWLLFKLGKKLLDHDLTTKRYILVELCKVVLISTQLRFGRLVPSS